MILENKVPPVIVTILFGGVMYLFSSELSNPREIGMTRSIAALVSVILGTIFLLLGIKEFKSAKTTVNPLTPDAVSSLVTSGVYRISRNPMYLGFALLLTSWAFYLGSYMSIFFVLGFFVFITKFQILPEERTMTSVFGDEFEEYSKSVRRWL